MKCTSCGVVEKDELQLQEWIIWRDTGGYASLIGDMVEYQVILCQACIQDKLGDSIEVINEWI